MLCEIKLLIKTVNLFRPQEVSKRVLSPKNFLKKIKGPSSRLVTVNMS